MAGNQGKWLEQLETAGNALNGWKRLEMDRHGQKWVDLLEINANCWKWQEWLEKAEYFWK